MASAPSGPPQAVHGDPQGPEEALSAAFSLLESLSKRVAALESRCRDAERRAERAEGELRGAASKRARVAEGAEAHVAPWQADFSTRHEALALGRPQDHEAPAAAAGGEANSASPAAGGGLAAGGEAVSASPRAGGGRSKGGETVAASLLRAGGASGRNGHIGGRENGHVSFSAGPEEREGAGGSVGGEGGGGSRRSGVESVDASPGCAAHGVDASPGSAAQGVDASPGSAAQGVDASSHRPAVRPCLASSSRPASPSPPSRAGSGLNLLHGPLPPPNLPTPSGSFSGLSHVALPAPLPRESPAGERGLPLPRVPSDARLSRRHEGVPMEATKVVMTQIVTPADSLGSDICAGGAVLSWIDVAAGIAAKSLSRAPVVTASLDEVHFLRPCHVRCVVTVEAVVNRVFRSSMEVGVRVEEEDDDTGTVHHCCSAFLTFVALAPKKAADASAHASRDGSPPPKPRAVVPPVYPTDDESAAVHEAALLRREQRLAAKARRARRAAGSARAGDKLERGWAAGGHSDAPVDGDAPGEGPGHASTRVPLDAAAAPHASALHALGGASSGVGAPSHALGGASSGAPSHALGGASSGAPSHALGGPASASAFAHGPSHLSQVAGGYAATDPSAASSHPSPLAPPLPTSSSGALLSPAPSSGSATLTPPAVAAHAALTRGALGGARSFSGGSVGMLAPLPAGERGEGEGGEKDAAARPACSPPRLCASSPASAAPVVRSRVPASATAAHGTQLVLPQHANSIGITFGGTVMRWMEAVAWVSARRVARGAYVLTAALDHLDFAFPTRVGDVIYVEARATAIFGSSVEVLASAWAETPEEGVPRECARCHVTVVSLDDAGVPREIPFELALDGPGDRARGAEAAERRVQRLRTRALLRAEAAHREARRRSSGQLRPEAGAEPVAER